MEALARRDEGILRAAGVRVRGVRRALEETAILEMLFDRVAGHLLNAPNMMDGVSAEVAAAFQCPKSIPGQSINIQDKRGV